MIIFVFYRFIFSLSNKKVLYEYAFKMMESKMRMIKGNVLPRPCALRMYTPVIA